MSWRPLDHTADAGLEVEAASWRELLEEAVHAYGEWAGGGSVPADAHRTERGLELGGTDRVEVWVNLWRALHRLWTVEGFLAVEARVETGAAELAAKAHVGCVSAGALDPAHIQDIKAVTWHDARVVEEHGRWRGTIVLDL